MMIQGANNGRFMDVSDGNRAKFYGVTESEEWFANESCGCAFSLVLAQTPTAAGDCFCYIKNTSSESLIISSIKANVPTDEAIIVKLGDVGTPAGGATATPANRNAGSGETITGTVEAGNDITGLTLGVTVDRLSYNAAESTLKISWGSGIVVPENKVLTLYAEVGAILINATLSMHYHGTI